MADETALRALMDEVAGMRHRLGVLEDVQAVRTLQFKYGYYMDKGLYDEVVGLFAAQGELHFMGGIFRGKAGLSRLYCDRLRNGFTSGNNGPVYGLLAEHLQLQDIVDIAPDRQSARGRFRAFMQGGSHVTKPAISERLPLQWWEAGVYENSYVKEDASGRSPCSIITCSGRRTMKPAGRTASPMKGISSSGPIRTIRAARTN